MNYGPIDPVENSYKSWQKPQKMLIRRNFNPIWRGLQIFDFVENHKIIHSPILHGIATKRVTKLEKFFGGLGENDFR